MEKILNEFNLNDKQKEKLLFFKKEFLEYNKKVNLTSRKSIEDFDLINLKDSLGIIKFYTFKKNQNVIDVGTGGGFPGIILAIIFDETNFYLNDSNNKKIEWIKHIVNVLELKNVFILNSRVEKLESKYNNYFDVVISRAVAKISHLLELTSNIQKINGEIILFKGKNYTNELIMNKTFLLNELGIKQKNVFVWNLDEEIERVFVIYKKYHISKEKYPREYSKIKSNDVFK